MMLGRIIKVATATLHSYLGCWLAHSQTVVLYFFAAPWLGHGRAVECYLTTVGAVYGIMLLIPEAAFESKATYDIAFTGYGQYLAIPLLTKAILSGGGLLMNILGISHSRPLRFLGALLGMIIWSFLSIKFLLIGAYATVGFPFTVVAATFSVRVMAMSLANLPRPGAPGAV